MPGLEVRYEVEIVGRAKLAVNTARHRSRDEIGNSLFAKGGDRLFDHDDVLVAVRQLASATRRWLDTGERILRHRAVPGIGARRLPGLDQPLPALPRSTPGSG